MLTILSIIIHGIVAFLLLPLAVLSLLSGSKPPEQSALTKYYKAEPYLMLVGNLFLISLSAVAFNRLAEQFSLLDESQTATLDTWLSVPFLVLLVVFIGFFVRAILKVRRQAREGRSEQQTG